MNNNGNKIKASTKKAIAKWGKELCIKAYYLNTKYGEGANTITYILLPKNQWGKTRVADSLINAGENIIESELTNE